MPRKRAFVDTSSIKLADLFISNVYYSAIDESQWTNEHRNENRVCVLRVLRLRVRDYV